MNQVGGMTTAAQVEHATLTRAPLSPRMARNTARRNGDACHANRMDHPEAVKAASLALGTSSASNRPCPFGRQVPKHPTSTVRKRGRKSVKSVGSATKIDAGTVTTSHIDLDTAEAAEMTTKTAIEAASIPLSDRIDTDVNHLRNVIDAMTVTHLTASWTTGSASPHVSIIALLETNETIAAGNGADRGHGLSRHPILLTPLTGGRRDSPHDARYLHLSTRAKSLSAPTRTWKSALRFRRQQTERSSTRVRTAARCCLARARPWRRTCRTENVSHDVVKSA